MNKGSGQVVILLLLIMVVALAIGLSTIGRSILEVSTSRKSEDSSRAFSAAEASIEKIAKANEDHLLDPGSPIGVSDFNAGNQAFGTISSSGNLPTGTNALGYFNVSKNFNDFAQFWLANPSDMTKKYTGNSFDIYFGTPDPDGTKYDSTKGGDPNNQPAIEVNIIYWDGTSSPPQYKVLSPKKYYDSHLTQIRIGDSACVGRDVLTTTDDGVDVRFYCKVIVTGIPNTGNNLYPIMVRVRLLYSSLSHPVALKPASGLSLPKQGNIYRSSGTSGDVKRTLELRNYSQVMPYFFDYAVFSANTLYK